MNFMKKFFISFAVVAVGAMSMATAQEFKIETGDEKTKAGDEKVISVKKKSEKTARIVVTGTRTKKLYKTAPVKTEVVSRKKIEKKGANTLFDALEGESGIIADNQCQNCGLNTVRLNGLEGNYTQILVNGVPGISSLASTYIFQQVPVEMIDRVEVVKGGGSALYGSGAVGGVVNIITRKPNTNTASFSTKCEFLDGTDSMAWTVSGYASAVAQSGRMGIALYGSRQHHDPYDRNGDHVSDLAKLKNTMFGGNGFYSFGNGMDLTFQFFNIHEYRRGGDRISQPEPTSFVTERIESDITVAMFKFEHEVTKNMFYEVNYNFSYMERDTYYGGREDLTDNDELAGQMFDYGRSKNPYHTTSAIAHYKLLKSLTLTGGLEFMHDDLWDGTAVDGEASVDEQYYNIGGFLQADWDYKWINLVGGLRIDKHSEMDTVKVSPRFNGIWKINRDMRWRVGWSTGFKAPQVFDEDFHIEQTTAGGTTLNRRIRNASDLKAESSHSVSTDYSIDFHPGKFDIEAGAGLFFTFIKDKMELDVESGTEVDTNGDGTADTRYFDRVNVDGTSKLLGYNFELSVSYSKWVKLTSGFTVMQMYELEDGSKMQEVPNVGGRTALDFFWKGLTLTLSNVIIGEQKIMRSAGGTETLVNTDTFAVFNARVAYKFRIAGSGTLELFAGVDNIGNAFQDDLDTLDVSGTTIPTGEERDAGYVYGPSKPRTYFMGAKAAF